MHLYVHIPFCRRRCSYCDFAIAVRRVVPAETFVATVLAEWHSRRRFPEWDVPALPSFYAGGGTPSLLDAESLTRLVESIVADVPLAPDAEVTLETNPDDVTPTAAARWRAAGFNRISLGAQSFDPGVLQWMHRAHGPEEIPAAVAMLRDAGFEDISLDLIFGLPTALGRDWETDLSRALALEPTHLSLYGLTVEQHTPLAKWVSRGTTRLVGEAAYAEEFLQGHERLTASGYEHYEVSNAARPGFRARHNSAYWQRKPYLGLGPSAHSAWGDRRQWNAREWESYRTAVEAGESPVGGGETLDRDARELEGVYLGLRTREGLPEGAIEGSLADRWIGAGWAERLDGRLRLTPEGWLRLDALVGEAARAGLNYPA